MATSTNSYSEGSIRVLKGLEPVKQRPGMYTRTDNPLHIIQEVLDNAADEALAGYGKRIAVILHSDASVSIEDDGRGIPFGLHPEEKAPVIELVFTRLHAGGKFDKGQGGAYSFSGGLHGVGVSVTNALSRRMEASSWREGQVATLVFEGGDGTLVLCDYKTDADISAETMAHYKAQLGAYAEILHRATGSQVSRKYVLHVSSGVATVKPV